MSPPQNLGKKTARGAAMLGVASVGGKVVTGLGQVVLAFLLMPEEFGLVAMAFTVMSFSRAIEQLGLREILVREQDRFDRWVNSAMWLAAAVGMLGMAITIIGAPVAAYLYNEPRVLPLILVLAPASPLLSMAQICESRLERDMRYKHMTSIHFGVVSSQMTLSVVLAALGFGAFSFVISRPVISLVRLVYVWRLVRPRVRPTPQLHRWGTLIRRGAPVTAAAICSAAIDNADYVILALITSEVVVGYYFFAYMQSTQVVQIFNNTFARVLMPSLSTMRDDPQRMTRTYLTGLRLIGAFVAPLCVMQAAVADPLIRILFGAKWAPAIPLLQILSIAMLFVVLTWPTISLMMAQGRYVLRLVLTGVGSVLFVAAVTAGALAGKPSGHEGVGAALGALGFRIVWGPIQTHFVTRLDGVGAGVVLEIFLRTMVNCVVALGPVWWLSTTVTPEWATTRAWLDVLRLAPNARFATLPWDLAQIAIVVVLFPLASALWLRLTQRDLYRSLVTRSLGVLPDRLAERVPAWVT